MQTHVSTDLPAAPMMLSGQGPMLTRLAIAMGFLIAAALYAAAGGGTNALWMALAAGFGGYICR